MDWLRLKPGPARRGPEKSNCYSLITAPAGLWPAAKGQKPKIRPVPARPEARPRGVRGLVPEIIRSAVPFRSGNYHILVKSGTQFRSVPEIIRSAVPFRSVDYHILVKSGTRRSRSVPPFRSVPEIITTPIIRVYLKSAPHPIFFYKLQYS